MSHRRRGHYDPIRDEYNDDDGDDLDQTNDSSAGDPSETAARYHLSEQDASQDGEPMRRTPATALDGRRQIRIPPWHTAASSHASDGYWASGDREPRRATATTVADGERAFRDPALQRPPDSRITTASSVPGVSAPARNSTEHRIAPPPYSPHDRQGDRDPSRAHRSSRPNPSDSTGAIFSSAPIPGSSTFALTSSSPTIPPPPAHNASAARSRVRAAPRFAFEPSTSSGARLGMLAFGPDGRLKDVNPGESVDAYANDVLLDKRGDYATSTLQASGSALVAAKQNFKRRGGRERALGNKRASIFGRALRIPAWATPPSSDATVAPPAPQQPSTPKPKRRVGRRSATFQQPPLRPIAPALAPPSSSAWPSFSSAELSRSTRDGATISSSESSLVVLERVMRLMPSGKLRDLEAGDTFEPPDDFSLLDSRGRFETSTLKMSGGKLVARQTRGGRRGGGCDQCSRLKEGCDQRRPRCERCTVRNKSCTWTEADKKSGGKDSDPGPRDGQPDSGPSDGPSSQNEVYQAYGEV